MDQFTRDEWRKRSHEDPRYAIALALDEIADAIERLGFNHASPSNDVPDRSRKLRFCCKKGLTR